MDHDLLTRLLDEAEASPSPEVSPPPAAVTPASADAAPLLGGLLSNPALLSALPTLLETLSPGGASARKAPPDRHTALLCAIKPYLGDARRETVDTLLRLARIWDALGRSGITLSGLSGLLGSPASPATGDDRREVP